MPDETKKEEPRKRYEIVVAAFFAHFTTITTMWAIFQNQELHSPGLNLVKPEPGNQENA